MRTERALVTLLLLAWTNASGQPAAAAALQAFVAGDLSRARALTTDCADAGERSCADLLGPLNEYARLIARLDVLTPAEAKVVIALDRQLSPLAPSRLTQPVLDHFVRQPLRLAHAHLKAGRWLDAWAAVDRALAADPQSAEARRFFSGQPVPRDSRR